MMINDEGFTLVEVMVATFIMGILSVMGLVMLDDTLSSKSLMDDVLTEVEQLEQARAIIKNDLAQISSRTSRDEFGFASTTVFEGGVDLNKVSLMSFVRNGNEMPGLVSLSSTLQHVEYKFEHGNLVRKTRTRVDATADTPTVSRNLLENLSSVEVEFFNGVDWEEGWINQAALNTEISAPLAVAFILETERYGNVKILAPTPAGY